MKYFTHFIYHFLNNLPIEEFFERVQGFYQDLKNNFSF